MCNMGSPVLRLAMTPESVAAAHFMQSAAAATSLHSAVDGLHTGSTPDLVLRLMLQQICVCMLIMKVKLVTF